jgi:hypothetical protein
MITRKTRLWIGLGAFVLAAHEPMVSEASGTATTATDIPALSHGSAERVAQNNATDDASGSNCAEESACANDKAQGGEGGEGGEGGQGKTAGDPLTDDLAYLHQLGILRGQLAVGIDLYRRGDKATAGKHMEYPADELYADLRPALQARHAPDLGQLLKQLADTLGQDSPPARVEADYAALVDGLDQAERAASGAREPVVVLGAIQRLVKSAAVEYAEAVVDGHVVKPREYQDSFGFVRVAKAMLAGLKGANGADPGTIAKVEQELSSLDVAWPDLVPPEHVSTDPSLLYGAAAKIEIALLSTKS